MHSSGNLFQSFTTLWENVYFLISNLEWLFTKARLCPLVMLSFFILKNISLFNPSYPCIILKTLRAVATDWASAVSAECDYYYKLCSLPGNINLLSRPTEM